MLEGFALAMKISQEVLRTLGQVHDSLEVDNLLGCIGNRRKRLRQQLQIVLVRLVVMVMRCHIFR